MPEVNIPLLRKAVEWAEAEAAKPLPESQWYQGAFRQEKACGTAYCIAGYVAQMQDPRYAKDVWAGGKFVGETAAEALGIKSSMGTEPGHLFYSGNTIEDVRRIAEDIAGERL